MQSLTTRSTGASNVGQFRTRKISRRAYKRKLWDSTMFKSHYRSVYAASGTIAGNAASNVSTVLLLQALRPDANIFWQLSGGLNPLILGGTPPTAWDNELVIRGGVFSLTAVNIGTGPSPETLTAYLIKTGNNYNSTSFPVAVQDPWDPSVFPNFRNEIGKIVMKRTIMLGNEESAQIVYRLPIHQVRQDAFVKLQNTYLWVLTCNAPEASTDVIRFTAGFNISFCGDIIT